MLQLHKMGYIGAGFVLLFLTVVSPLMTYSIAYYGLNWGEMGDVGDSYGPMSTILSGAALIGVVATIALQRRQASMAAEQATRQLQFEMIKSAWENPELLRALEVIPEGQEDIARQFAFLNVHIMHLRMGLRAGQVTLGELEDQASHHFSTEAGAYYWSRVESHMRAHFESSFVDALARGASRALIQPEGFFLTDTSGNDLNH